MTMPDVTVMEIEAAINYWRTRMPSEGEDLRLCQQASALSLPYARMIFERRNRLDLGELAPAARDALDAYRRDTCA